MRLLVLFLMLILSAVSVFSLSITPDYVDIDALVGVKHNHTIQVHYDVNTSHQYTIYNVTFPNITYFHFDTIRNMTPNQTVVLNYSVRTHEAYEHTYHTYLQFYYITETWTDPLIHDVHVSNLGYSPIDIDAHVNDSIAFFNDGITNRTITYGQESFILPVNGTYTHFIDELENITFIDEGSSIGLDIFVEDNYVPIPTIDTNLFIPYNITIDSNLEIVDLDASLTKPKEKIEYYESTTGILILRPSHELYNLHFDSDDWITFSENDITIDDETFIFFTLKPVNLTSTGQTNRSYTKLIDISGDNIEDLELSFDIFILSHDFDEVIYNDSVKLVYKPLSIDEQYRFCEDNNWEHDTCEKYIKNVTVEKYVNRTINPDISEKTLIDYFEKENREESDINTLKTRVETMENNNNEIIDSLNAKIENLSGIVYNNVEYDKKVMDYLGTVKTDKNVQFVGILIISVIIVLVGGVYYYKKKQLQYHNYMRMRL